MKVLHLSSERSWRGGEQQISYLIEESIKQGVECHVITRKGSKFEEHARKKNWSTSSVPFKNQFDISSASLVKSYCRTHNIDLIHVHSSHSHAIAVWSAVLGCKTPIILSRRVDFPPKKKWLTKFKYFHKNIKKIICVSYAIEEILRAYGLKDSLLTTVHSGTDLTKFANKERTNTLRNQLNVGENEFLIGNISALADHKDYPTFIRVANELKDHSNLHFVIIGSGELESELKAMTNNLGLDNLSFTGFRSDVPDIFKDLDLFLMTSKTEGLGTTVLDAFANKVPVVGTKAGGIPEMVIQEKTGLLNPIGAVEEISKAVLRIVQEPELRHSIISNATEKLEEFKKEKTAQRTVSIYNEVLNKN